MNVDKRNLNVWSKLIILLGAWTFTWKYYFFAQEIFFIIGCSQSTNLPEIFEMILRENELEVRWNGLTFMIMRQIPEKLINRGYMIWDRGDAPKPSGGALYWWKLRGPSQNFEMTPNIDIVGSLKLIAYAPLKYGYKIKKVTWYEMIWVSQIMSSNPCKIWCLPFYRFSSFFSGESH